MNSALYPLSQKLQLFSILAGNDLPPLLSCKTTLRSLCLCLCILYACVRGRVGDGWRQSRTWWLACHQRSERAQTCQQMCVCAYVCVCLCARLPSASVTAAVQRGDSPSSANEERQYGNVAHLCQQGTFSSALVYFVGFHWKEKKKKKAESLSQHPQLPSRRKCRWVGGQ